MKTTYLIRKNPKDTTSMLIEITKDEWHLITEANKGLPTEEKRHFITDVIADGQVYDCMVIEVGYEEYKKWHAVQGQPLRNRRLKQSYQHISLPTDMLETIATTENLIAAVEESLLIKELEVALGQWNPWALPVYELYVSERKDKAIEYLVVNHGVSKATAYRYIGSFKEFVKKFLGA